jgi:serine/threonine-protein kinase
MTTGRRHGLHDGVHPVVHRRLFELSFAAIVLATAPRAVADVTKEQCVEADTNAQTLRREGKFVEARKTLAVCSAEQCPPLVRDDCTRQIEALEELQPTVVFDAKDPAGADLSSVRVSVDGRPVVEKIDGAPIAVDRGEHHFTFETAGRPSVTVTLIIKEAEKERRVSVIVGTETAADAGARTTHAAARPSEAGMARPSEAGMARASEAGMARASEAGTPRASPASPQKTLGVVVGGAGIVGLAVGAAFGALAAWKWSATKSDCVAGGTCRSYSQAAVDYDATVTDGTVSTVGLAAGAALIVLGVTLWASAPSRTSDVAPTVGLGPGAVTIQGRFR